MGGARGWSKIEYVCGDIRGRGMGEERGWSKIGCGHGCSNIRGRGKGWSKIEYVGVVIKREGQGRRKRVE